MKQVILKAALFALVMTGCTTSATKNLLVDAEKGKVTPEGDLVFFEWTTIEGGERHHRAVLRDDFGMMIFYDILAENPAPRFELYIHADKSILKTQSNDKFKQALSQIPSGRKLHYYNTCAGGTHHGLDPSVLNGIKTFCKKNGIIFQKGDDKLFAVCTCP